MSEASSSGTIRPGHKREQSKLRQHLSVIGESSSGHSRESTSTAHGHSADAPADADDDDDAATEKGSDGAGSIPIPVDNVGDEDDTLRLSERESLEGDAAAPHSGARGIRDDLSESSGPRWS